MHLPIHRVHLTNWIAVLLVVSLTLTGLQAVVADQTLTRSQQLHLTAGDSLVVQSDQPSIQQVFVQGNLSATNMTTPAQYPSRTFEMQLLSPGDYQLTLKFDCTSDYKVNVFSLSPDATLQTNSTTYYLSSGQFELDIQAMVESRPASSVVQAGPPVAPWDSFVGWIGKFGQAFPLWVKALYFVFGLQFFAVGGFWIRREGKRKKMSGQGLDYGDKAYLWLDVAYKFLVASFVAILAIMGGELLLLFVLRFMFLISLNLLSLWDLFVIGFAVGAIILVYLLRFTLERAFDLKPVEDV